MTPVEIHKYNSFFIYDPEVVSDFEELSFDSQEYAKRNAIIGFAEGRGTVFFVDYNGYSLVLRHYKRGGLIANYISDEYFWLGFHRTRAWKEWTLLAHMRDCNLPVPKPVAARVVKHGMLYTSDILTERLENTQPLSDVLEKKELNTGYWSAIGAVIRRFHNQKIYHSDLNANNILMDDGGRFYLIDFDKCYVKNENKSWKLRVLKRLKRSLLKLSNKHENYHFTEENWQQLLQGYNYIVT